MYNDQSSTLKLLKYIQLRRLTLEDKVTLKLKSFQCFFDEFLEESSFCLPQDLTH